MTVDQLRARNSWLTKKPGTRGRTTGPSFLQAAAGVPSAATSVASFSGSSDSATLTWEPPASTGNSTILGYIVARDGADGGYSTTWPVNSPRSATFYQLTPGATYNLSVTPFNTQGQGAVTTTTVKVQGSAPVVTDPGTGTGTNPGTGTGGTVTPPTGSRRLGHPFWNTKLAPDAPLAPTSSDYVRRLAYQATMGQNSSPVSMPYGPPYNTGISTTGYSLAVYDVTGKNIPRVKVWARDTSKTNLQPMLDQGVPVPNPALIPGGTVAPEGTDGAVTIIDGNEVWELWQLSPGGPSGYDWQCQQGGKIADKRSHPGWWSGSPFYGGGRDGREVGWDWGVSASGVEYLGGILLGEDYYADVITHPILLALVITGAGSSTPGMLLPATRYDQMNFTYASNQVADAYRIPEGSRFRLPANFDIAGWVAGHAKSSPSIEGSTAPVLTKILIAMRDYGIIINESAGFIGFSGEHEKVYGTPYHPLGADKRPNWGNFGQQIPWEYLVQVAAPTTDISIPGAS